MSGFVMNRIHEIVERESRSLSEFLQQSTTLFVVELDFDLTILYHNHGFSRFVGRNASSVGRNFASFLLKESAPVLPLKEEVDSLSIPLNILASDTSTISVKTHIRRTACNGYLLIGEELVITSDDILKKMTLLNNEVVNMARDLRRKNRQLQDAHDKDQGLSRYCTHLYVLQGNQRRSGVLE